jgi:nuclear transport factor 2 (NTF2) superfamily protein
MPEDPTGKRGMVATPREARLRSLSEAFNAREVNICLAAMTPDVDWANGWEGGRVVGREAVRDYWQRQWAEIDSTAEPIAVTERPDGKVEVAVKLVVRDKAGNVLNESRGRHVYEFRGDLVERMTTRTPASHRRSDGGCLLHINARGRSGRLLRRGDEQAQVSYLDLAGRVRRRPEPDR